MIASENREYLIDLIKKYKDSNKPFPTSASLYHDLGIAGDDAGELLDEIHERFGTSFQTMDFDNYFPNEPESFWYHWARVFGIRDNKRKALSLDHLLNVIERGHWFEAEH